MNTRLTINLQDGLLEVEGNEEFVRSVYQDFKEQVARVAHNLNPLHTVRQLEHEKKSSREAVKQRQPHARRSNSQEGVKAKASDYKPTFKNLDLARLGDFYSKFDPQSHNEKILCFAIFLRDHLKIAPCSADDVYTCYFTLKSRTKIPQAFQQAFITAKNRTHYIEFVWPDKIEITIAGENFSQQKLGGGEDK